MLQNISLFISSWLKFLQFLKDEPLEWQRYRTTSPGSTHGGIIFLEFKITDAPMISVGGTNIPVPTYPCQTP